MIQAVFKRSSIQMLLIILMSFLLASCGFFWDDDDDPIPITYSVGGSVNGLSGTLVLQNNGANNLTITADGPFTFKTGLEDGAAYSVTVSSQPAGQTCTVTNEIGTINTANVTNVQVACTNIPTYSIGGSVNGLSGTLVLQNNGANNLTITADGPFTFIAGLEDSVAYSVTVFSQPTGQTCTVTNGASTINGADVSNVQVACVTNTYKVGGTVNGLSGTLVLQNNGGDNLTRTADGAFTFATDLAHGAAYSVTVFSQPAGQTCTVTNGASTINAANVTNVDVACTNIPTYSVGGTVNGLTGTLILQNNGGDNLTRTADGAFTFATTLTNGAAYSVTVFSQPAGQTCTVTSGASTINAANVTNVDVACADDVATTGWAHPASLSDGIITVGGYPERFQVAMANNGDAVISNLDLDSEGYWHVFLSEKRGGTWYHPQNLSEKIDLDRDVNDNGAVVIFSGLKPQVAMSDNGDTVITWNQENQFGLDSIYMSEKKEGLWITPVDFDDRLNIGDYQSNNATPQVSMAGNGDTVIVWDQTGTRSERVFMRERRGGTWLPYTISDYISPADSSTVPISSAIPQVAMADTGDTVITWQQKPVTLSYERQILRSEYLDGGPWNHPASYQEHINPTELITATDDNEHGYADTPRTAISSNGDAIIVWRQNVIFDNTISSPHRFYFFMSEYDGNTNTWTDPQTLDEFINLDTGFHAFDHQVAMDDNGNAVIVWEHTDATNTYSHIYMLQKSGGSWAATPVDISPDGPRAHNPQIAMAGNGEAVVIWEQDDNSLFSSAYNQIFMSEYRNGTWTHPAGLDDYISLPGAIGGDVGSREDEPHLAMDDNGNTIIVWQQYGPNNEELLFISEYRRSDSVTHNGITYGTVTSPHTGKVWLDRNLGASQVCTALNDTACYGDYYQWGREFDGHQISSSGTTTTPAPEIVNVGSDFIIDVPTDWTASGVDDSGTLRSALWSKNDGTSVCPAGYRVPTWTDLADEDLIGAWKNREEVFNDFLKLPSAGGRRYDTGLMQDSASFIWTSNAYSNRAGVLAYGSTYSQMYGTYSRAYGFSVRCIKN